MIRIVCIENDIGAAINVGGPTEQRAKTFDVQLPEVEAWLDGSPDKKHRFRSFQAIEILPAPKPHREGEGRKDAE